MDTKDATPEGVASSEGLGVVVGYELEGQLIAAREIDFLDQRPWAALVKVNDALAAIQAACDRLEDPASGKIDPSRLMQELRR